MFDNSFFLRTVNPKIIVNFELITSRSFIRNEVVFLKESGHKGGIALLVVKGCINVQKRFKSVCSC
jgi:hypothetical protein